MLDVGEGHGHRDGGGDGDGDSADKHTTQVRAIVVVLNVKHVSGVSVLKGE
jgi:hypothetical protein